MDGAAFTIRVEGGCSPNAIEGARGSRVRLTFDRQEGNPFACGIGMLRGTIVVE